MFKLSGFYGNDHSLFKQKFNLSNVKTDSDTLQSAYGNSSYDANKFDANYQLDINFDREGYVTQGISLLGEYQKDKYKGSEYTNVEKKFTDKSIAAEYRLFTENDHSLSLSGRYIDNSLYGNAFTGRIAGGYRLSPNFRVHASFATATQTPTVSEALVIQMPIQVGQLHLILI